MCLYSNALFDQTSPGMTLSQQESMFKYVFNIKRSELPKWARYSRLHGLVLIQPHFIFMLLPFSTITFLSWLNAAVTPECHYSCCSWLLILCGLPESTLLDTGRCPKALIARLWNQVKVWRCRLLAFQDYYPDFYLFKSSIKFQNSYRSSAPLPIYECGTRNERWLSLSTAETTHHSRARKKTKGPGKAVDRVTSFENQWRDYTPAVAWSSGLSRPKQSLPMAASWSCRIIFWNNIEWYFLHKYPRSYHSMCRKWASCQLQYTIEFIRRVCIAPSQKDAGASQNVPTSPT
jgi:hypothetical protein